MCCLKIKRTKEVRFESIALRDGVVIEEAEEEGYKYLGILNSADICQENMKEKMQKEYYKELRLY